MFTIQRRRKMIDIEESYYTITKVTESYDCDQGSCKLYEFEYGDKTGIPIKMIDNVIEEVNIEDKFILLHTLRVKPKNKNNGKSLPRHAKTPPSWILEKKSVNLLLSFLLQIALF